MYPRLKPLVALLSMAASLPTLADSQDNLDPIVVTATRQQMRASELLSDVSVIQREEIERSPQMTVGELLARQPGIEFASNGGNGSNSSIFMRGTNSGHTLVLIDGMRLGSATAGQMSSWSRLPLAQIDRIEILRGPSSSLYGSDAIGGVVQIFTRQGQGPMQVNAEIGAGSNDTYTMAAGLSGQQNNWRYSLNADVYRTEGINTISNPKSSSYNSDRDGFYNQSVAGSLAYAFAKGHELGASVFYSDGYNQYDAGKSTATAAKDARNYNAVSSFNTYLKNALTENWKSTLSFGHSVDDSANYTDRVLTGLFRTDQDQLIWQNDIRTGVGNFLLGVERLEQAVSGSSNFKVTDRTTDSLLAGWNGSYQSHRLQANVRYDDNSQFGDKTTGSLAYGYQIASAWRANLGYGTAFKAPSFNDLYYPKSGKYVGNPNLLPESSRNREASIHYEAGAHHVSLTWFLNRVENLIVWPSTGATIMPANVSNARIEGATLAYEGRLGSFDLLANYNYLDPRDADTGRQLPRRASNYGTLSLGQQIGPWDWRVELFASDRRFSDDRNDVKLHGYALTNLYGAYRLNDGWSVFGRVNNLFDREYNLVADYGTPGTSVFVGLRYSPK